MTNSEIEHSLLIVYRLFFDDSVPRLLIDAKVFSQQLGYGLGVRFLLPVRPSSIEQVIFVINSEN